MKQNSETTVEILTEEQLNVLNKDTQETVNVLTETLPSKQVLVLNPVISKLIEIKKFKEIKYDKENEKDSIAKYKEAVKVIGSFNTMAKKAKSEIKKPLDQLGKDVLSVERSILAEAQEVKEFLETEFDEYIKKVKQEAADKAAKKEKEVTEKIEALEKDKNEAVEELEKNNRLNFIKYNVAEKIEKRVADTIDKYSLKALEVLRHSLFPENYEEILLKSEKVNYAEEIEKGLYTQEDFDTARAVMSSKLNTSKMLLDSKIQLLKNGIAEDATQISPVSATPAAEQHSAVSAANAFMSNIPVTAQDAFGQSSVPLETINQELEKAPTTPEEFIRHMEHFFNEKIVLAETIYANSAPSAERKRVDGIRILLTKSLDYTTKPIQ